MHFRLVGLLLDEVALQIQKITCFFFCSPIIVYYNIFDRMMTYRCELTHIHIWCHLFLFEFAFSSFSLLFRAKVSAWNHRSRHCKRKKNQKVYIDSNASIRDKLFVLQIHGSAAKCNANDFNLNNSIWSKCFHNLLAWIADEKEKKGKLYTPNEYTIESLATSTHFMAHLNSRLWAKIFNFVVWNRLQ